MDNIIIIGEKIYYEEEPEKVYKCIANGIDIDDKYEYENCSHFWAAMIVQACIADNPRFVELYIDRIDNNQDIGMIFDCACTFSRFEIIRFLGNTLQKVLLNADTLVEMVTERNPDYERILRYLFENFIDLNHPDSCDFLYELLQSKVPELITIIIDYWHGITLLMLNYLLDMNNEELTNAVFKKIGLI